MNYSKGEFLMKKLAMLLALGASISMCMTGCNIMQDIASEQQSVDSERQEIIAQLDDEQFITGEDRHIANSYMATFGESDLGDSVEVQMGELTGTQTFFKFSLDQKTNVDIEYTLIAEQGTGKLIVVSETEPYVVIGEINEAGKLEDKTTLELESGKYSIKLVGNQLKGKTSIFCGVKESKYVQ